MSSENLDRIFFGGDNVEGENLEVLLDETYGMSSRASFEEPEASLPSSSAGRTATDLATSNHEVS